MLAKWVVAGGVVLTSLVYGSAAQADGNCPPGYYEIRSTGVIGCAPYDQSAPPPNSSGSGAPQRKLDNYIAVAWHPNASDVWATWNHRTEDQSKQAALNACTEVMGEGCTIAVYGQNISVAIARNQDNSVWQAWGKTPEDARQQVLSACAEKQQRCQILHSFTAKPIMQLGVFTKKPKNYFPKQVSQPSPASQASVDSTPASGKILFSDPNIGIWSMLSAGDGTGKNCAVAFAGVPKGTNTVLFTGPTQKGAGAILFQGTGIPTTNDLKEVRATLTFKGSQPMPINAALVPGEKAGMLLLTNMVDTMRQANAENEITLHLDGKEVFRSSMTGFMKARSAMLQCMKAE